MIELIFLAVGLLLGCAMKQYKRSGSTAVAIILVTYFLSVITSMQANLDFLNYFTPFKYFDAAQLLRTGQLDVPLPAALGCDHRGLHGGSVLDLQQAGFVYIMS